jgi:branched-chain amino acid transport system substrate-binding protein
MIAAWARVPTNRKLGVLWANDDDGRVFAQVMPPPIKEAGFNIIDPGRFDLPSSDYTPEIAKFKSENAEVVFTVIPGPDFTIFWNQCAQQGFKPKIVSAGKVGEFPQGHVPLRRSRDQHDNRGLVVEIPPVFLEPHEAKLERTCRRL